MSETPKEESPTDASKPSKSAELRRSLVLAALRRFIALFRLLRRWISRREWTIRLLGLEPLESPPDAPGVILLQIDGLSRRQFERALKRGKMPFVNKLCQGEDHRLASFYSGLPSTRTARKRGMRNRRTDCPRTRKPSSAKSIRFCRNFRRTWNGCADTETRAI